MHLDPSSHLPVAVRRFDGESGMSHIMRAFWSNGLSLKRGYDWLHVPLGRPLRDVDARVLAWAVQAPPDWLAERSFMASGLADDRWLRLGTLRFSYATLLVGKSARLCPRCLSESGFCELSWSFKLAPVCARHGVLCVGECSHCRRPISWDRPQIDICTCGRYFKFAATAVEPPASLTGWAKWLADRLAASTAAVRETRNQCNVPRMLDQLSLDGAFRLVEAFGLLRSPDERPRVAATSARSVAGVAEVLVRGLERLAMVDGSLNRVRAMSPHIHIAALERLRAQAVDPADANCAALLLRHLGDRSDREVDMRGRHPRGQLSLFS